MSVPEFAGKSAGISTHLWEQTNESKQKEESDSQKKLAQEIGKTHEASAVLNAGASVSATSCEPTETVSKSSIPFPLIVYASPVVDFSRIRSDSEKSIPTTLLWIEEDPNLFTWSLEKLKPLDIHLT